MTREWKPGEMALVERGDGTSGYFDWPKMAVVRVRREAAADSLEFAYVSGGFDIVGDLGDGFTARPLVVIDPEDREQVERLTSALEQFITNGDDYADGVQAALHGFANPTQPKPSEPRGLGAVVEDAKGLRWTRAGSSPLDGNWLRTGSNVYVDYIDVAAVRVLSEGVS